MNTKSLINKVILFFCLLLFYGINVKQVQAQTKAVAGVYAIINKPFSVAQIKYINGFSQNSSSNSENSILTFSGNGLVLNSSVQNLARFSITSENTNAFSISLPAHPVILKNLKNEKTVQVSGWQSSAQPEKSGFQKNIWVINLNGSLKMGSPNDNLPGAYFGTYPVTFVFN